MSEQPSPDSIVNGDARPLSRAEQLAELRGRGPVSAMIADIEDDARLDADGRRAARYRVKAEALAQVASVVLADPKEGPVGVMLVDVGSKEPAVVSDVHVDPVGALVCTITHPDIPAGANPFRFVNPPLMVPDGTTRVEVDPRTGEDRTVDNVKEDAVSAGRQIVRDVVAAVIK